MLSTMTEEEYRKKDLKLRNRELWIKGLTPVIAFIGIWLSIWQFTMREKQQLMAAERKSRIEFLLDKMKDLKLRKRSLELTEKKLNHFEASISVAVNPFTEIGEGLLLELSEFTDPAVIRSTEYLRKMSKIADFSSVKRSLIVQ